MINDKHHLWVSTLNTNDQTTSFKDFYEEMDVVWDREFYSQYERMLDPINIP